jgi:Lipopolysaccharide-assembly
VTATRRRFLVSLFPLAAAVLLPSCQGDGNFTLFGYTTRPNYDPNIRSVRVPIFGNRTLRDSVREGVEFQLTEEVKREIQLHTPFRIVGANDCADTELIGTIIRFTKTPLINNQENEIRDGQVDLGVEVVWRDLHTGEVLSQMKQKLDYPLPLTDVPLAVPLPPVQAVGSGTFAPEIGQSFTTARQDAVKRLAVQIRQMMETPWTLPPRPNPCCTPSGTSPTAP